VTASDRSDLGLQWEVDTPKPDWIWREEIEQAQKKMKDKAH
jgi:hypothetical protein